MDSVPDLWSWVCSSLVREWLLWSLDTGCLLPSCVSSCFPWDVWILGSPEEQRITDAKIKQTRATNSLIISILTLNTTVRFSNDRRIIYLWMINRSQTTTCLFSIHEYTRCTLPTRAFIRNFECKIDSLFCNSSIFEQLDVDPISK